jgi:antitoxin component of RelBE/YafQ-DinJ toxin-antitoxin module
MADEQTTVDTSGITRSADGTIADGQSTQVDQSNQNTTQSTESGKTLLTDVKEEPKVDAAKTDDKKPDSTAPEKYEDYKLPEGMSLDAEVKTKADALFKGLGLTQDQAQSVVNLYGEQIAKVASAPVEAYKTLTSEWKTESESHPDLRGKLGPGKEINVRIAKALDSVGDPKLVSDFKALMDLTGAGNNQAFIRVLDKFAAKLTEGTHVAGNGPSKDGQSARPTAAPTAAAAIWPSLSNR